MKFDYLIDSQLVSQKMAELKISSLSELAKLAAVHRNTIYPLIRGERSPFIDSYLAICKVLQLSPSAALTTASGKYLSELVRIAEECCSEFQAEHPTLAIFLFGSRAKGTAREYSDYDLGLTGGESPIEGLKFLPIKEFILARVDDFPVKVDVLHFDQAPKSFLLDFDSPILNLAGHQESTYYIKGVIHATQENAKVS